MSSIPRYIPVRLCLDVFAYNGFCSIIMVALFGWNWAVTKVQLENGIDTVICEERATDIEIDYYTKWLECIVLVLCV